MTDLTPATMPPIEEWDSPHTFRDVAAPESIRPVCYCGRSEGDWPHA